jgi:hypothetical protein
VQSALVQFDIIREISDSLSCAGVDHWLFWRLGRRFRCRGHDPAAPRCRFRDLGGGSPSYHRTAQVSGVSSPIVETPQPSIELGEERHGGPDQSDHEDGPTALSFLLGPLATGRGSKGLSATIEGALVTWRFRSSVPHGSWNPKKTFPSILQAGRSEPKTFMTSSNCKH